MNALRKKAVAASVYPILRFVVMGVLLAVMLLKVIPQFQDFYSGFDLEVPLLTRFMMALALGLKQHLFCVLLAVTAVWAVFKAWVRREGSAIVLDRLLRSCPTWAA